MVLTRFNLKSRLDRIKTSNQNANIYLKRDDDLSGLVSGSKNRKIASILYFIEKKNYQQVFFSGSSKSNNVLALIQILKPSGIKIKVFLKEQRKHEGNAILIRALLTNSEVQYVSNDNWVNVDHLMSEQASSSTLVLPEGGVSYESIPGAFSLAEDLNRNINQLKLSPQHVFVDAGTCWQALGLVHGLALLGVKLPIHIVQMADGRDYFQRQNKKFIKFCQNNLNIKLEYDEQLVKLYKPNTAKSFGATNKTLFNFIKGFAKEHGILLEPLYSAKLVQTALNQIENQNLHGDVIIIISGSPMSLLGFEDKLF